MKNYRVGLGFDVHQLSRKKKDLILGGAKIPSLFSLKAISDGDVVLHAISDALCGASGLGDIGDYFPPQVEKSKGIDSKKIGQFILKKIGSRFIIENLDLIIVTDRPPLSKYKKVILKSLKKIFKTEAVNLKIKSKEKLSILGSKDAMSCLALAVLRRR